MLPREERLKSYEPFFGEWYISDYRPLGDGSSGVVYSVHREDGVENALKMISIPKDEAQMEKLRQKRGSEQAVVAALRQELKYVENEITIMRSLIGHLNIVCFESSIILERKDMRPGYGWDILICMEKLIRIDHFFDKNTLRKYNKVRNEELILQIWLELLNALKTCEGLGIVHQDVKPENIFYAPGHDHYKLGDFGVSANLKPGSNTLKDGFAGTKEYMAPEVAHQSGADSRSDIYSLAMVIYQFLNNDTLPFYPKNSVPLDEEKERIFKRRVDGAEVIPRLHLKDERIMNVLARCLEHDPRKRYARVDDVITDIRRIVSGRNFAVKSAQEHHNAASGKNLLPILGASLGLGFIGVILLLVFNTRKPPETPLPLAEGSATNPPAVETQAPENTAQNVVETYHEVTDTPLPVVETTPLVTPIPTPQAVTETPANTPESQTVEVPVPGESISFVNTFKNSYQRVGSGQDFYTYRGTGSTGFDVCVYYMEDGSAVLLDRVGIRDGQWKISISENDLKNYIMDPETGECTLAFAYLGEDRRIYDSFYYDDTPPAIDTGRLGALHVGSSELRGYAVDNDDTSLPCTVTMEYKGTMLTAKTDKSGWFSFNIGGLSLQENDKATIKATDAQGNVSEAVELTIGHRLNYAEIKITTPASGQVYPNIRNIQLSGTAEPGETLYIYWDDESEMRSIVVDDDGSINFMIPVSSAVGDNKEVESTLHIQYRQKEDGSVLIPVCFDALCEISVPKSLTADGVLSVKTDPNARVSIGGAVQIEGAADDDGSYELALYNYGLKKGDQITVSAVDAMDNASGEKTIVLDSRANLSTFELAQDYRRQGNVSNVTIDGKNASAGETIVAKWEDIDGESVRQIVSENGTFSLQLPVSGSVTTDTLFVSYENGAMLQSLTVSFDRACALSADSVKEDSRSVTGLSDPNANITLLEDGSPIQTIMADGSGAFRFDLDKWAYQYGRLSLTAEDAYGNSASVDKLEIGQSTRRKISAEIKDLAPNGYLTQNSLTISVQAEPNSQLQAVLTRNDGFYIEQTVSVDASGKGEISFTKENYPTLIEFTNTQPTIQLSYADYDNARFNCQLAFKWDIVKPELTFSLPIEYAVELRGSSEPKAQIVLVLPDGREYTHVRTSDSGEFALSHPDGFTRSAGEYQVYAVDEAGNRSDAYAFTPEPLDPITIYINPQRQDNRMSAAAGQRYQVYGQAHAGKPLILHLNDKTINIDRSSPSKSWDIWLDGETIQSCCDGDILEISASYAGTDIHSESFLFNVDSDCDLNVNAIDELSELVSGTTDQYAELTLTIEGRAGISVYNTNADVNGNFSIMLDQPIFEYEAEHISLSAVNLHGIRKEQKLEVQQVNWAKIRGSYIGSGKDGVATAKVWPLLIQAEPEKQVSAIISLGENVYAEFVRTNANGEGRLSLDLSGENLEQGKNYTIYLSYDGISMESNGQLNILWDGVAPKLEAPDSIDRLAAEMAGTTDPHQRVSLVINGAARETLADANGRFSFRLSGLNETDQIELVTQDDAGNASKRPVAIRAAEAYSCGELNLNVDSGVKSGDIIRLSGWLTVYDSYADVYICFRNSDGSETLRSLNTLDGVHEMSQSEYSDLGSSIRATAGYRFNSVSYTIPDNVSGDCEICFKVSTYGVEPEYIAQNSVKLSAQTQQMEAKQLYYVGDGFAIGMDAQQPIAVQSKDNVTLFGWIYCDSRYSASVSIDYYQTSPINADWNISMETPIDPEQVQMRARKVSDVCPEEVKVQLSDVTPDENIGGFVLTLDLSDLSDGDYMLTLQAMIDGPDVVFAQIPVRLATTGDQVNLQPLLNEWYPLPNPATVSTENDTAFNKDSAQ